MQSKTQQQQQINCMVCVLFMVSVRCRRDQTNCEWGKRINENEWITPANYVRKDVTDATDTKQLTETICAKVIFVSLSDWIYKLNSLILLFFVVCFCAKDVSKFRTFVVLLKAFIVSKCWFFCGYHEAFNSFIFLLCFKTATLAPPPTNIYLNGFSWEIANKYPQLTEAHCKVEV